MEIVHGFNAVYGVITQGPRSQNSPTYWYFGEYSDTQIDRCADMCQQTLGCEAFALHLSSFSQPEWRHQCYGRSGQQSVMVQQGDMVSGNKVCSHN